jgi:hypothetical protein
MGGGNRMKHLNKALTLILLSLLIVSVKECSRYRNQTVTDAKAIYDYISKNQMYETSVNDKNQTIATQNQVIVDNSKDLQKLLKENSELKKVNKQIAIEAEIKIANVIAEYSSKIPGDVFIFDTVEVDKLIPIGVKFGTKYNLTDKWYSIAGSVEQTGLLIDSLTFKTDTYINIGYSRDKWYKRLQPKVEIVENNPYTTITNLNNVTIKDHKKWHQRPVLYFLAGSAMTAILILK